MYLLKKIWILCFLFILAACSIEGNEGYEKEEEETSHQESKTNSSNPLKEDLIWMEEMNTDLHAPYEPHILTYYDHEPIGPAVYYDLRGEFDTNRYPFYVSFNGDRYKIELGWTGPDLHAMEYTEMSESVRKRRFGSFSAPFLPFYSDEGWNVAKDETDWQITAADVTGDGMLEIIVTARMVDPDYLTNNEKIMAIYRYTGSETEPLELIVHLKTDNKSHRSEEKQKFYFTEAFEWVTEEWGEELVVAYLEDGAWYVNTNSYLPHTENLSSAHLLTGYSDDGELEYVQINEEERTSQKNHELTESTSNTTPTVPKKSELALEGILNDIDESCQYDDNPCEPLSSQDIKERAGNAAIFYIEKSLVARKKGDYSIASPYIAKDSPIAKDMQNLVPNDASRGVSLAFEEFQILDVVDRGNNNYDVFLKNTYDITGTKKTGLRTFESTLRIVYNPEDDQFYAYELIEEVEI